MSEATVRTMPSDAEIERFAATLAPIYSLFNWHWVEGGHYSVPGASQIATTLRGLCADVVNNETDSMQTGGLTAKWDEDYSRIAMLFVMTIEAEYDN